MKLRRETRERGRENKKERKRERGRENMSSSEHNMNRLKYVQKRGIIKTEKKRSPGVKTKKPCTREKGTYYDQLRHEQKRTHLQMNPRKYSKVLEPV